MTDRFATSRNALAMCDVCGFQYKLRDLKSLVVKGKNTNIRACWECWNEDHPQLKLGEFPIRDPQAIRNPRPDTSLAPAGRFSSRGEQWGWSPVGGGPTAITPNNLVGTSKIGVVTV